jgi:hypothetical protein
MTVDDTRVETGLLLDGEWLMRDEPATITDEYTVRAIALRALGPRRSAVSAGSARCASAPTRRSSSTTNRQPVVASSATSSSWPRNRSKNRRTLHQS